MKSACPKQKGMIKKAGVYARKRGGPKPSPLRNPPYKTVWFIAGSFSGRLLDR